MGCIGVLKIPAPGKEGFGMVVTQGMVSKSGRLICHLGLWLFQRQGAPFPLRRSAFGHRIQGSGVSEMGSNSGLPNGIALDWPWMTLRA